MSRYGKTIRRLSMFVAVAVALSLLAAFPALSAMAEDTTDSNGEAPVLANLAPKATYRGSDKTNSNSNYGESDWNLYHTGRLNDGVIPDGASDSTKGQNVEINLDGFVSGTTYLYFCFTAEVEVTEIKAYANTRATSSNRGYPTAFNVYVGNSETDISADTLFGSAVTTDTDYVREYTVSGNKTGNYVIFELGIESPYIVIAFGEVEIWGYGDFPEAEVNPTLESPVLTSSSPKAETFTVPTISWEQVEGAVAYDVYLNGALVLENTAELSYVPDISVRQDYTATDYHRVQVVAKSGSDEYADSEKSEEASIIYVAVPTDRYGSPMPSADFIIDAGHGGSDSGALGDNGTRRESLDNLNMAFETGERLEALGFTVAYTRITDDGQKDTVRTKAAKGEAGDYSYYISFHRNSFSNELANGIEVLYKTDDTIDRAFAQSVQDELVALNIFTDRGIKARNDLTVLNNVNSIPTILLELSFISCPSDNEKFDTFFNDIATAVAKGAIEYAGYKTGTDGSVTVNDTDYTLSEGGNASVSVNNYGADSKVDISGSVINGLGITAITCSVDGEEKALEFTVSKADTEGYLIQDCASFSAQIDFTNTIPGTHTVVIKGYNLFAEDAALSGTFDIFTLSVTVAGNPVVTFVDDEGNIIAAVEVPYGESAIAPEVSKEGYVFVGWNKKFGNITTDMTVTAIFALLGDVNRDGEVDSLDAATILRYDAGITSDVNPLIGDVNGDGETDSLDAAKILRYDAGLISDLN